MYREQAREQNPEVLQETRDNDPHYKEFEEAKDLGGNGQAGFMTPTPGGAAAAPGARAQRASQRAARTMHLEERIDELTVTLSELVKQGKAPAIRRARTPKTQASSSSESESGSERRAKNNNLDLEMKLRMMQL